MECYTVCETVTERPWIPAHLVVVNALQDELEAELEDLEGAELEEQLINPSAQELPQAYRPNPVPAQKPKPTQVKEEEDELAALQAEMAL